MGANWPAADLDEAARLLRDGNGKFPSGLRTLPPELVDAIQRERILNAMLRAAVEIGYRQLSVQDVLDRSGISRPTFYENFSGKEDCFLTAFELAADRLTARLRTAAGESGERWRDRLRMGLAELLRFVADEPDAAWTLIVEARAACPSALVRRDELLDGFAAWIDTEARAHLPASTPISPMAAAGVVGGIETLLYNRVSGEQTGDLESLLPSMMYFVALAYEGHDAADEELLFAAAV